MGLGSAPQTVIDFNAVPPPPKQKPIDFSAVTPPEPRPTPRRDTGTEHPEGPLNYQRASTGNILQQALGSAGTAGQQILDAPIDLGRSAIDLLDWMGFRNEKPNPLEGVDAIKLLSKLPGAAKEEDIRGSLEGLSPVAKGLGKAAGSVLSFASGAGEAGAVGKVAGAPGKLVEALGAPGYTLGKELIEKFPQAAKFAQIGGKNLLPGTIAGSTGFGLYNLLGTEGGMPERTAAMGHGMVMGAGLHALGELGRAADAGITRLFLNPEEAKAVEDLAKGIRETGKVDIPLLKKIPGRAISAALEGTGFSAMDPQWLTKVAKGLNGDKDAGMQAMAEWAGSLAGVLAAKTGDPNAYLWFKSERPDLNNSALRAEAGQFDQTDTTKKLVEPLWQAGWESRQEGDTTIMSFPGHELRLKKGDLDVNPEVAQQEIAKLAHDSIAARLAGEAALTRAGYHESGAGGFWIGPDGAHYAIDMEGKLRRQEAPGYSPWLEHVDPNVTDPDGKVRMPEDGPLASDPAVQHWRDLVQLLDKVAVPTDAKEVLHAAVEAAAKGDPNSPRISALTQFLKSVLPDQIAPHFAAENLPTIATVIGRIGAGTFNPNGVFAEIQRLIQPREGVIPDAEQESEAAQLHGDDRARGQAEGREGSEQEGGPGVRGSGQGQEVQEVEDRSGERGAIILSGGGARIGSRLKQNVKEMLESGRHLTAQFHEQQPTELENLTRGSGAEQAGHDLAERMREALDLTKENLEQQEKPLADVMRIPMKTMRWLEEKVDNGAGSTSTRLRLLVENQPLPGGAKPPADAVQAVNWIREVLAVRSEQAAYANAMKPSRTIPGEYEPFVARPAAEQTTLPQMRGEGYDKVVSDPETRQQLADAIAKLTTARTGKPADAAKIAEELRESVEQKDPRVREAAFEKLRELHLPADITDKHGRTQEVLENNLIALAQGLATEGARRSAFIKVHGQDFPEGAKMGGVPIRDWMQQFAVDRPGLKGELERLSKAGANPETVDFARNTMENLGGLSKQQDWMATPWGSAFRFLDRVTGFGTLRTLFQSANAFLLHATDPLVSGTAYGGPVGMLRTMALLGEKVRMDPADVVASIITEMQRQGRFQADNASMARDFEVGSARRGIQAKVRKIVTLPASVVRAGKDALLYKPMAEWLVEDMKDGKVDGSKFAELATAMSGFDRAQSKLLLSGKAPDELYNRFERQFVAGASGELMPGEGSALRDSRVFNTFWKMQSFWMGRANTVLRLTSMLWRRPELWAQTGTRLATMMAGSALAGNLGTWIAYQLRGLSTEDFLRELKYAPMHAVWNTVGHLFGGLPGTFLKAFTEGTRGGVPEWLASLSPMTSVVGAAVDASSKVHSGELTLGEGLLRLANNTGAAQIIALPRAAAMALGFLAHPEVEEAKSRLNAWKRIENIPIDTNQSADIPFSVTKRMVDEALRSALNSHKSDADIFDDPEIANAMKQALGKGTGEQIAQAVMAKSPLNDIKDPRQRAKLESFVGPQRMETLYRYDQALQMIAAKYRDEAGTPKDNASNFTERMLAAGHQASLGDRQGLKELVHEVAQREGQRQLIDLPFTTQIGQLATTIYDHPEAWQDIFTPMERSMLIGPGQIGTIQSILENKAMDSAVAKKNKGDDREIETEVRKMEAVPGAVPAPAPGTAKRIRAPIR